MLVKNPYITVKYIRNFRLNRTALFYSLIYILKKQKSILLFNKKNYCIYTHRRRSVFSSFKMCRHQLKKFFDDRSFSNLYVK